MQRPYGYGVLTKPKVLSAMLALYVTAYVASYVASGGSSPNVAPFLTGMLAVATAVAGANALNCYVDRDIDVVMARTGGRPLALGTVSPSEALTFSTVLMFFASALSISLGSIPFILFLGGSAFYILFYTMVLKRRTSLSVLATGPSVAAPAWFGWFMGGASFYPAGFLLGLLVAVWGPLHLWSLSYVYSKDYARVNVPAPSNVLSEKGSSLVVLGAVFMLVFSSYLLTFWAVSYTYVTGISILNTALLYIGYRFYKTRSSRMGWLLFKLTAPYIILVLLLYAFDMLLFG